MWHAEIACMVHYTKGIKHKEITMMVSIFIKAVYCSRILNKSKTRFFYSPFTCLLHSRSLLSSVVKPCQWKAEVLQFVRPKLYDDAFSYWYCNRPGR